jgi:hypothetical protein
MKTNNYNSEKYTHLIGKKINAYKYDNDPDGPLSWTQNKEKLLGKECTITEIHSSYPYIKIVFDKDVVESKDSEWWLLDGCEDNFVIEKSEEDLYIDIRKLLIKI